MKKVKGKEFFVFFSREMHFGSSVFNEVVDKNFEMDIFKGETVKSLKKIIKISLAK